MFHYLITHSDGDFLGRRELFGGICDLKMCLLNCCRADQSHFSSSRGVNQIQRHWNFRDCRCILELQNKIIISIIIIIDLSRLEVNGDRR